MRRACRQPHCGASWQGPDYAINGDDILHAAGQIIASRSDGTLTITSRISWTDPAAIEALRLANDVGNALIVLPFYGSVDQIDFSNLLIANNDNLACVTAGNLIKCRPLGRPQQGGQ